MSEKETEKTRVLVRQFADHISALRFADAFGMLNPDGRYIVIGKTKASGIYVGPAELLSRLVPLLGGFKTPPRVEFSDIVAEGGQALLRGSGAAEGPFGAYDQPYYAWTFRVQGDGFSEVIEFMDTGELESAVFGQKLVAA